MITLTHFNKQKAANYQTAFCFYHHTNLPANYRHWATLLVFRYRSLLVEQFPFKLTISVRSGLKSHVLVPLEQLDYQAKGNVLLGELI
jgi:hypothetical protein